MKTKKYLIVKKHTTHGAIWDNPLKLSEAYLISRMAQDDTFTKIVVSLGEMSPEEYKNTF